MQPNVSRTHKKGSYVTTLTTMELRICMIKTYTELTSYYESQPSVVVAYCGKKHPFCPHLTFFLTHHPNIKKFFLYFCPQNGHKKTFPGLI